MSGENGKEKQKEAIRSLETLIEKCDKIAVAKSSKFQQKEGDFSERATDGIERKIARIYWNNIKFNHLKYEEVDIEGVNGVVDINPDDVYLIKTHYKTKGLIVTTDNPLIDALQAKKYSL